MLCRRIVIVFEFSTLNGGERSMLAALDQLRSRDCQFEFCAIGPSSGRLADALDRRGIPLTPWSPCNEAGGRRPSAEIEQSLVALIEMNRPDLVHANSLSMGRLLGRLASRLTIPITGHLRDIIKLSAAAIADLNRTDLLAAVSEATRAFHVGQGLDVNRVRVVRNGIDLDLFQPRNRTGWLSDELGVPRADTLIACIGQIGLRKGQDILAASVPAIVAQIPGAQFLLIGERTSQKAESVEFERAIHRRFSDAGLSQRLHLLGHRDDVGEILNEIDLLVHPVNQEPYGRVLLEASAVGVPIVATDVGGTAEIVIDGLTGKLVVARDPAALAQGVVTVLGNPETLQKFRENARRRAVEEFSIEAAALRLEAFWAEVLPVVIS